MAASLIGADGERYVIPVLDRARVVELRGPGFLIAGDEIIPISRGAKNIRSERYRQTWWCVPIALDDAKDGGTSMGVEAEP